MRQSMKLGIATVTAAVALFGGAPTASAYAGSDPDPDLSNACDGSGTSQVTCQFGEDDQNVTIYQTFNLTDFATGDIDDVTFGPDLV